MFYKFIKMNVNSEYYHILVYHHLNIIVCKINTVMITNIVLMIEVLKRPQ